MKNSSEKNKITIVSFVTTLHHSPPSFSAPTTSPVNLLYNIRHLSQSSEYFFLVGKQPFCLVVAFFFCTELRWKISGYFVVLLQFFSKTDSLRKIFSRACPCPGLLRQTPQNDVILEVKGEHVCNHNSPSNQHQHHFFKMV